MLFSIGNFQMGNEPLDLDQKLLPKILHQIPRSLWLPDLTFRLELFEYWLYIQHRRAINGIKMPDVNSSSNMELLIAHIIGRAWQLAGLVNHQHFRFSKVHIETQKHLREVYLNWSDFQSGVSLSQVEYDDLASSPM